MTSPTLETPRPGEPLLEVRDLSVEFGRGGSAVRAVRSVSLDIARGETVGLVGESGSGKSVTALSILQLLRRSARYPSGSIRFHDRRLGVLELAGAPDALLRRIRGDRIAMIFQEPMTSLNPLHTVGQQVSETLRLHRGMAPVAARARVLELLERVGLADAERRLGAYPHELSGGQRQRVMIAMALANEPDLLIADEPTTALDVTIQAQILELLARIQAETGMAMLWITHDLGIVRRISRRVVVMQQGCAVEEGACARIFESPAHAYTRRLVEAVPSGRPPPVSEGAPELLRAEDVRVHFPIRAGLLRRVVDRVRAVDGVSFSVRRGESVGLVGESGSGKTTLAFAVLRLIAAGAAEIAGRVVVAGADLGAAPPRELRRLRRHAQIVFQDPFGSLSPRMSVGQIVGEGLEVHEPALGPEQRDERVRATLRAVELDPDSMHRYPHEFSGGQRQRIALARALVLEPGLLVLDEPTSALDMTVQQEVIRLLRDLQQRKGLAYLFISHDLRVIRALCHQVVVMRQGIVVEQGGADALFAAPREPYTRALLAAALEFRAETAEGVVAT